MVAAALGAETLHEREGLGRPAGREATGGKHLRFAERSEGLT